MFLILIFAIKKSKSGKEKFEKHNWKKVSLQKKTIMNLKYEWTFRKEGQKVGIGIFRYC